MYLHGLAVNCLAVKWTGCQMSHGQLSGGQTSCGQMAAVKCRGPSQTPTDQIEQLDEGMCQVTQVLDS